MPLIAHRPAYATVGVGLLPVTGAAGNGTTDDRAAFAATDVTALATGAAIAPNIGTYRIGSNITIASHFVPIKGMMLSIDAGVTVTFTEPVEAGLYQWISGAGSVVFSSPQDVYPEWWGALGNGVADDAVPIQKALTATPQRGGTVFRRASYISGAELFATSDYSTISGRSKIIAKAGVSFLRMLHMENRTGITVNDLEFDANQANRIAGQSTRFCGVSVTACTDVTLDNITVRNVLGFGGVTATAIGISGSTRTYVHKCKLIDCGTAAQAGDGVYASGEQNSIVDCQAYRCTDTAYVLENSNYSIIGNCSAKLCIAAAAISAAGAGVDYRGNIITGLTASTDFIGGTGFVCICALSTGHLVESEMIGGLLQAVTGATGAGPSIYIRTPSTGRIKGLTISNVRIDGAITQGILIEGGEDVMVMGCRMKNVPDANITFRNNSVRGLAVGNYTIGGVYGITTDGNATAHTSGNVISSPTSHGIYAGSTSQLTSRLDTILTPGVIYFGNDGGATLSVITHFGSDIATKNVVVGAPAGAPTKYIPHRSQNGTIEGNIPLYN